MDKEYYLYHAPAEKLGIIAPALVVSLMTMTLSAFGLLSTEVNPITWLLTVVLVDVAHVWSTLFRTYLNRQAWRDFHKVLWLAPLACYFTGIICYAYGPGLFWRVLAYFAVFHFVRQQYGLYALYWHKENDDPKTNLGVFEKIVLYSTMVIPLSLWHLMGPQAFNWFIPFDFLYLNLPKNVADMLINFLKVLGPLLLFAHLIRQVFLNGLEVLLKPKNGILIGTYLIWWSGIVWLANDFAFTLTNVLAHGLPYFTLIGLSHFSSKKERQNLILPKKFSVRSLVALALALVLVFALATLEEGLWDVFLWRDHPSFFSYLYHFPIVKNLSIEALIVPLLALPQATHYALDGFIWRSKAS